MPETCPDCGAPFLLEKITKRHGRQLICNNEACSYVRSRSWRRRRMLKLSAECSERPFSSHFSARASAFSIAMVTIIGGGLAGCEAAWQAASLGVPVVLHEMRPVRPTAVHKTDGLAELVCSNSFRGDKLDNAVGLLKEEMRRLGSLVMRAADAVARAGRRGARRRSRAVRRGGHARDRRPSAASASCATRSRRVPVGPTRDPVIVATGPLTSDALRPTSRRSSAREHLSFFDAISPIVLAESIDMSKVFRASRWDRSLRGETVMRRNLTSRDRDR